MQFVIRSVGHQAPLWITDGIAHYQALLRHPFQLHIETIKPSKHSDINRLKNDEGQRLLTAIPQGARLIALDPKGQAWTTEKLFGRMQRWHMQHRMVILLIGGAHGHSQNVLEKCHDQWSLSALTLPHMLVRVVLAEQLYRLYTLYANHPYHK